MEFKIEFYVYHLYKIRIITFLAKKRIIIHAGEYRQKSYICEMIKLLWT